MKTIDRQGMKFVTQFPPEYDKQSSFNFVTIKDKSYVLLIHPEHPPLLVDLETGILEKVESYYEIKDM